MFIRICADILLFIAAMFLPASLVMLASVPAVVYFENFYEILAVGLFLDGLYGIVGESFFHYPVEYSVIAAVLFVIAQYFSEEIRPLRRL